MHLLDINVWLALTFEAHVHCRKATAWFDRAGSESCAFCRFTQQGFLRLATNPKVFKKEALTMARAWSCYDQFMADERVFFLKEPEGLEEAWRRNTHRRRHSHKVWSDAYLAAFAETAGFRLVTFDGGFKDFKGMAPVILRA